MRKTTTAEKSTTVKTSEAPAKETVTKDEVTGTKKETVEKLVKKPIGRPRKKVDTEQKKAPKTTATKKTTKKTVTEEKPAEKIEEASTEVVEKRYEELLRKKRRYIFSISERNLAQKTY